ncbi:uncharacterized protein LOC129232065, partial [Uloborus diversus]|uniref:uncharacterized protein LOC129232065 n=1 Tax=Uloborus diversus TaxID=327109 RepID=UPI002409629A
MVFSPQWDEIMSPDRVVVHAGANDVIEGLPSVSALVSGRLKALVDEMRALQDAGRGSYALSAILPKNDPVMTFNNKINIINSDVSWYAQRRGIDFIDHAHLFWKEGSLQRDLFRFDGSLNEEGLRGLEESLFDDDSFCGGRRGEEKDPLWNLRHGHRLRKRPSLELKDILPLERKIYDKHLPPKQE